MRVLLETVGPSRAGFVHAVAEPSILPSTLHRAKIMDLAQPSSPFGIVKRLSYNPECQVAITEALHASEQLLRMLHHAIRNPRTTLAEIADIMGCNATLAELMVRLANSSLLFNSNKLCDTVEGALRLVGLREVSRIITTASTQSVTSPVFCA